MRARFLIPALGLILACAPAGAADTDRDFDFEALLETVLSVQQHQRERLDQVVFDAEYVEGEIKDDGELEEKKRYVKKIYLDFQPDTVLFRQEFLEYYKDGELQSEEELRKEAEKRREEKEKRKTGDISMPVLAPLEPDNRAEYELTYKGVTEDEIDGYLCHHIRVTALEEKEGLINADYFFETSSFHLVRVEFSPAKLVKKTLFKLNELNMTLQFRPYEDDIWLPVQFDIYGKGRAAFLFGVGFAGTEYYRNPQITLKPTEDI
jgi:hypothetical protein